MQELRRPEHDYLDEIDAQVRRYTRAATQKIENLTSREQNVRGDLDAVLTALSRQPQGGRPDRQAAAGVSAV